MTKRSLVQGTMVSLIGDFNNTLFNVLLVQFDCSVLCRDHEEALM